MSAMDDAGSSEDQAVRSDSQPPDKQQRAGSSRSRATVRASLACVPCRSKHLKCDGGLPECTRCRIDEKSCHYAKSRRGIRDPKKRNAVDDDALPASRNRSESTSPAPEMPDIGIPVTVARPLRGGWSVMSDGSSSGGPPSSPTAFVIDLYYTYFHDSHSWLPPKKHLLKEIQRDPESLRFLGHVVAYIGSKFSDAVDSAPLRQRAYTIAVSALPTTIWNTQAFLTLSIAAFGEGDADRSGQWMERAIEMAFELGLQHKGFADAEENPVLAESYRRTYWGLFCHGALRTVRDHIGHFILFAVPATADLPCEEWEYQTGNIPKPVSLTQYHDKSGPRRDFSSWAYLADLVRICGEYMVPILNIGAQALPESVDEADQQLVAWLWKLPEWKKQLVDPDGAVDMVLLHAQAIAHIARIRIQLTINGADAKVRTADLITKGPIMKSMISPPSTNPSAGHLWVHGPTALQASLHLARLFNLALPPTQFSPAWFRGLDRGILAMLDAYLYCGSTASVMREKASVLVTVLAKSGEFWPDARVLADEAMAVINAGFIVDVGDPSGDRGRAWGGLIDSFVPPNVYHGDSFYFGEPKTAEEMSERANQLLG